MPSGSMPTYPYRPADSGASPRLRTASMRRARLFAGGTYFRARDPGGHGNSISVTLIEWLDPVSNKPKGQLIVTNHATKASENILGVQPDSIALLEQKLNWNEEIKISRPTPTSAPRAFYSIRCKIAPSATAYTTETKDLGEFTFSRVLHIPSKLSLKFAPGITGLSENDEIVIKPRTRVYDLQQISKTSGPIFGSGPGTTTTGWDPDALREQVNASDPWIEMVPRSGVPKDGPLVFQFSGTKHDVQDDGVDDDFLSPFDQTFLSGGDGLPQSPVGERTGPTRSLIFINYGERKNGSMGEVSEVYEWVGDSATSGEWRRY